MIYDFLADGTGEALYVRKPVTIASKWTKSTAGNLHLEVSPFSNFVPVWNLKADAWTADFIEKLDLPFVWVRFKLAGLTGTGATVQTYVDERDE